MSEILIIFLLSDLDERQFLINIPITMLTEYFGCACILSFFNIQNACKNWLYRTFIHSLHSQYFFSSGVYCVFSTSVNSSHVNVPLVSQISYFLRNFTWMLNKSFLIMNQALVSARMTSSYELNFFLFRIQLGYFINHEYCV